MTPPGSSRPVGKRPAAGKGRSASKAKPQSSRTRTPAKASTPRPKSPQGRGRRWPLRLAVATLVVVALGVAALLRGTWEVRTTFLNETTFRTSELTGELRVVQLTDFHNIPRPAQVRDIVDLVKQADPDLIALTGDLIDTKNRTMDPTRRLLEGLADLDVPRYFVDGNHDHWSADHGRLHELLERYDVTVLADSNVQVKGEFGTVSLIGVDDYFSGHGDLAKAVQGLPREGFRLVLTHSPEIIGELSSKQIDYAMCGHTHGGQIRLPFIGAIYQPGGNWFPKISKGAYVDGHSTLFVDSGLGVTGPKFRLFNQSQVTLHRIGPNA